VFINVLFRIKIFIIYIYLRIKLIVMLQLPYLWLTAPKGVKSVN
jgi:hypothetical protein